MTDDGIIVICLTAVALVIFYGIYSGIDAVFGAMFGCT